MSNERIEELQQRLNKNMDKAIKLAEKNCTRNEQGYIVFTKDEITEMEEFLGLDKIEPININLEDNYNFEDYYNEELYKLYNSYKVADKDNAHKSMIDCSKKYNKALNNLADNTYNLGVSKGIISPIIGKLAQDFLKDSEKSTISKETIKKCKELAKMITKKY